ncbi:hypothetical protein XENORESO_014357 [Xenotaenia resolanae]|uniref:Uncharacterized protein n=1 Tax=Xenotaenia resolanae TaxID=208358 RepID=A0ABV0W9J3_9TELE
MAVFDLLLPVTKHLMSADFAETMQEGRPWEDKTSAFLGILIILNPAATAAHETRNFLLVLGWSSEIYVSSSRTYSKPSSYSEHNSVLFGSLFSDGMLHPFYITKLPLSPSKDITRALKNIRGY